MGTSFELVLGDPCGEIGERGLRAAGEAALEVIHETEERWSLFRPSSRLAQLNLRGHLEELVLDADDLELFELVEEVHETSGGAFDPDVARYLQAEGHFDRPGRTAAIGGTSARPTRGRWILDCKAGNLRFTASGPALDLGGVAKGFALDLALRELVEAGIQSAFLQGGSSSVLALGCHPGGSEWSVLVDQKSVPLRGRALATSSSGSQRNAHGDSHILLRTDGNLQSAPTDCTVCVCAPTAARADAWATALCARPELRVEAREALRDQAVEVLSFTDLPHSLPC